VRMCVCNTERVTRAYDDALLEAFGVAPVSRIVCRKELWNLRVGVSLSIYHHRYIERKVCTCVCVCVCVCRVASSSGGVELFPRSLFFSCRERERERSNKKRKKKKFGFFTLIRGWASSLVVVVVKVPVSCLLSASL
jgi:hypothetical protein